MFNNKDFYPTPKAVIELMLSGIDLSGKRVLEPSAGSGNIVDHLQIYGAEVMCCEISPDLAKIVSQKCKYLQADFMNVQANDISHIDLIVMNPPFSADEKHITHAWNIAPEGCQIIALCNNETLVNDFSQSRKELNKIIKNNGSSEALGSLFTGADRKTGVSIGLVKLFKPRTAAEAEWEGYFDLSEEQEERQGGIIQYNVLRDIVSRYVGAVKMYNEVIEASEKMNSLIRPISNGLNIKFGAHYSGRDNIYHTIDRETFKKELQKSAWQSVFDMMKMKKYLTQKVIGELNAFVEKQTKVPFTLKNVYLMIEMIYGTHEGRLNEVLVEAFDRICGYSDTNNTFGKGWKTNSNYKINRRFIHPYVCDYDRRWPSEKVSIKCSYRDTFDDIVKALCLLTGEKYEDQINLSMFYSYPFKLRRISDGKFMGEKYCYNSLTGWDSPEKAQKELLKAGIETEIVETSREWGKWQEWGFFNVRGYMKGTMHFEFKDEKVLNKFNSTVAKIKGWQIPQKTDHKKRA